MLKPISDRVREQRLGNGARAGQRVRGEIRRVQWDFARRNAPLLATGAVLCGAVTGVAVWLAPNDFLRGTAVGAGTVFTLGGLAFLVVLLTGTGSRAMGAVGETWTSTEIRPLRSRGWKLVDHVFYRYGDVDHVLAGPGGVVVVETKWSAEPWALEPSNPRLVEAVRQVQRNANDLRLTVPELRHRDGSVRSALFLWGGSRTGGPRPATPIRIDDVDVIVGAAAAKAWRDELSNATALLDAREVQAIWARLRKQAADTDERDAKNPPPPTIARLYWTALATLSTALLGVLVVSYPIAWTHTTWSGYPIAGVAIIVGAAARRANTLRYPALGWLTGVTVITVALIAVQLSG